MLSYDSYGNVQWKCQQGDLSLNGDERIDYIEYDYDTTYYLVSRPRTVWTRSSDTGPDLSKTIYTYFSGTNSVQSKTYWLNDKPENEWPTTNYTYYSNGNLASQTDARHNTTTFTYDSTETFQTAITSPRTSSNVQLVIQFPEYDYRFSKPKQKVDANANITNYEYDELGRLSLVTGPSPGSDPHPPSMHYYYLNYGTLGQGEAQDQCIQSSSSTSTGNPDVVTRTYFDGFGREIKTRATANGGASTIRVDTIYDSNGKVWKKSLPYFEGTESPRYVESEYNDPLGRLTSTKNPGVQQPSTIAYSQNLTTYFDSKQNKREELRDAYGRISTITQYDGSTPYSTFYWYDTLGNLTTVLDCTGQTTLIGYDSLSRKRSINDPSMGYWTYDYDPNGNLIAQTDAKSNTINFEYDELNRPTLKDYPSVEGVVDIVYHYDETGHANGVGRLTTVTDESGMTTLSYDPSGRVTDYSVTPQGQSIPYIFHKTYDDLGRITSITYPDNEGLGGTVNYSYPDGNLYQVSEGATDYATFTNYTALGQPRSIEYANEVRTDLAYYDQTTSRLQRLTTNTPLNGTVLDLAYNYDNNGNLTSITDQVDPGQTQTFSQYDGLDRLKSATGAYGTSALAYDGTGNIIAKTDSGKPENRSDQQITFSPNKASSYDNMPSSINGTEFTYNYLGQRASKTTGALTTTLYFGNLYEVTAGVGSRHIFAGGRRIASKYTSQTYYYHTNHQGSLRYATRGSDGLVVQGVTYYPFGEIHTQTGSVDLPYKFTGQEYDPEIRLYYFGARYYDATIGRFITPDSVVQSPGDPQSLNRYAYCRNNPLLYTDPTGHIFGIDDIIIGIVIGAALGATMSAITGGNIGMGALTGAITGGFLGGAGAIVGAAQLTGVCAAGVYAAAGASAGAINAGISGSNVGIGALTGGAFAAAAYAFPIPGLKIFPEGPEATFANQAGSIANRMISSSLTGAAFGAASAGMTGGDMLHGAAMGAAAWAAGSAGNMLIGNAVGWIGSGFQAPTYENGMYVYPGNSRGALTIGNAVWAETRSMDPTIAIHEEYGHGKFQSNLLGPAYLPAHLLDQATFTHMLEYGTLGGAPTYYDLPPGYARPWTWWQQFTQ